MEYAFLPEGHMGIHSRRVSLGVAIAAVVVGTFILAHAFKSDDLPAVPVFASLRWTPKSGVATDVRFAGTLRGSQLIGSVQVPGVEERFDVFAKTYLDGSLSGLLMSMKGAELATFEGGLSMAGLRGSYTITASDSENLPAAVGNAGTWERITQNGGDATAAVIEKEPSARTSEP